MGRRRLVGEAQRDNKEILNEDARAEECAVAALFNFNTWHPDCGGYPPPFERGRRGGHVRRARERSMNFVEPHSTRRGSEEPD